MVKKTESYDEIKTTLNKLHDKLYSTDDILKKRFIDNPNKEELSYKDLSSIIAAMSNLESHLVIAKDALLQELIHQSFNVVK